MPGKTIIQITDEEQHKSFHTFRHSFATVLNRGGKGVCSPLNQTIWTIMGALARDEEVFCGKPAGHGPLTLSPNR